MLKFEKGAAFPLPHQKEEGVTFSIEPYTMFLIYRFKRPTQQEIQAFATAAPQFGVTVLRNTMFILSHFSPLGWMDTPYSAQLSSSKKSFPDLQQGQGYSIDAFLVDCETNTLVEHRLLRLDTLSSERMKRLVLADQERTDFTIDGFNQAVQDVYRNYSTRDLLKVAEFQTKLR
ncbi:MAG: hypothetical protein IJ315_01115 [Firmicutes bacterium]|nr:hypothetical protein [Bacillota bacterium]